MAKVFQEEDAQAAKGVFDDLVSQLEDSGSETLGTLIGAFDNAVTKNQEQIPDSLEPLLDGKTIFDSIVDKVQEKIEASAVDEGGEQAQSATLLFSTGAADEESAFTYGTGAFLGFLAVAGIGLYAKSSLTKKNGKRVQSYDTEEPLL